MNRSITVRSAVVAASMTAAALSAVLASAAPAQAGPSPQTTGCSGWAKAPQTKYHVRECAGTVHKHAHKYIKETIYIKNAGGRVRELSGEFRVSAAQSGSGAGFQGLAVGAGRTKTVTRTFRITDPGTYTVAADITVDGHRSPVVHTTIEN
jgi:uncharacterized membrane protein